MFSAKLSISNSCKGIQRSLIRYFTKQDDCVIEDVFDSRHIMTFCYKITIFCSYLYRLLSCNSTLITFISISINSMIHSSLKEVVILQTGPF